MNGPDLSTTYLGLEMVNPIVASASPMTAQIDRLLALQDAGVGAVVLPSLFEEQIEHEEMEIHRVNIQGTESFAEATSYLPELEDYNTGPDQYLLHVADAVSALRVPVIASLNGTTTGGWVRYARMLEQAGAHALELNIYFIPTSPQASSADVEKRYLELIAQVRAEVKVPLAVKLAPHFSALAHFATQLVDAGVDGLVLFNRFFEPDIDLDTLEVVPRLRLSTSDELLLPIRWAAILRDQIECSIAVTSGVHTGTDAVKALLAGADVAMMASALLKHGAGHVSNVLQELDTWMAEREYESVEQLKGSMSRASVPDPEQFERANYMKTLMSFTFDNA